jgi:hypothetical protein
VLATQKATVERPRVGARRGKQVLMDSYAGLRHDGRWLPAVRERIVTRMMSGSCWRGVENVLENCGIEKFSASRQFVQGSAARLKNPCEKKLTGGKSSPARQISGMRVVSPSKGVPYHTAPSASSLCSAGVAPL